MRLSIAAALLLAGLSQISPAHLEALSLDGDALSTLPMPSSARRPPQPMLADVDADGEAESISLENGRAVLHRDSVTLWASPEDWDVRQARLTDLNQDTSPEIALLVWREFAPWPIDAYIPSPGRISSFHDSSGFSCHLILMGWRRDRFQELWAGSALARPLVAFESSDLDADGDQELAALEGDYQRPDGRSGAITVWEWNGFGFTLAVRSNGAGYSDLTVLATPDGRQILLAQNSIWGEP